MQTLIAGVDEVGRGALAGPIVAAAVIFDPAKPVIEGLKDSKVLSKKRREELNKIIQAEALAWAVAEIGASEIDQMGIAEANRLVMRQAIAALSIIPHIVRVDGFSCKTELTEEVYIKGDTLFPEISAASIIAKVYRDNFMYHRDAEYPIYGFMQHVGYGTKVHIATIKQYGLSDIHRASFCSRFV